MKSIARIYEIDKDNLSGEFYFSSLMGEAFGKNLLLKKDIEKIQGACFELLRYKTKKYTYGESSSVPVKQAESIMQSNLFTIGLYLKSLPHPDDAVSILLKEDASLLYDKGFKIINRKIHLGKHMHEIVKKNLIKTNNHTYNETFIDAIEGFFKLYAPPFRAHEVHITADYPLAIPVTDLAGIEFIIKYLTGINLENKFCGHFSHDAIEKLSYSYHEDFDDLVINIFEMVLTTSLGCILLKLPFEALKLSSADVEKLSQKLSGCTLDELEMILYNAYMKLVIGLGIDNNELLEYLEECLENITGNVHHALSISHPELVFICTKSSQEKMALNFALGNKMDDFTFRDVINEISFCRNSSDKISVIFDRVKSFADLEDICLSADLSGDELTEIFKKLAPVELSALVSRHLSDIEIEAAESSSQELLLIDTLTDFIETLQDRDRFIIERMSQVINLRDGSQ